MSEGPFVQKRIAALEAEVDNWYGHHAKRLQEIHQLKRERDEARKRAEYWRDECHKNQGAPDYEPAEQWPLPWEEK